VPWSDLSVDLSVPEAVWWFFWSWPLSWGMSLRRR